MAQFVRPISDITNAGSWTNTPLWSDIADSVGSGDGSQVDSDSSPTASETFTVDGGTVSDPGVGTGHTLRFRGSKSSSSSGADYDIVVQLRQGYVNESTLGTLIVTGTIVAVSDTTLITDTTSLSIAQANSITDYADLQFRCWAVKNGGGAGRACRIVDMELETPDAPVGGAGQPVTKRHEFTPHMVRQSPSFLG